MTLVTGTKDLYIAVTSVSSEYRIQERCRKQKIETCFNDKPQEVLTIILKIKTSLTRTYEVIYVCGLQNVIVWHFLGGEQGAVEDHPIGER